MKLLDNFVGYYLGTGVLAWVIFAVVVFLAVLASMHKYGNDIADRINHAANGHFDGSLNLKDLIGMTLLWPVLIPATGYIIKKWIDQAIEDQKRYSRCLEDWGDK